MHIKCYQNRIDLSNRSEPARVSNFRYVFHSGLANFRSDIFSPATAAAEQAAEEAEEVEEAIAQSTPSECP